MAIETNQPHGDRKGVFLISGLAALIGGLCCLTPVVLVLLGLSTLAFANSLGTVLYGEYRWAFRIAALVFLALTLVVYFRRRGLCTLDQAKRHRNRILNTTLVVLIFAIGMYIFWTYFAVHWWGVRAGLGRSTTKAGPCLPRLSCSVPLRFSTFSCSADRAAGKRETSLTGFPEGGWSLKSRSGRQQCIDSNSCWS